MGGVGGLPEGEEALEGVGGVGGDDGRAAGEVAREVGQRAQQRVLGQLLPEGVQVAHGVGREHGQAGRVRVRRRQLGQHRRLVELRHVDQRARLCRAVLLGAPCLAIVSFRLIRMIMIIIRDVTSFFF